MKRQRMIWMRGDLLDLEPNDILSECADNRDISKTCKDSSFWKEKANRDFGIDLDLIKAETAAKRYQILSQIYGETGEPFSQAILLKQDRVLKMIEPKNVTREAALFLFRARGVDWSWFLSLFSDTPEPIGDLYSFALQEGYIDLSELFVPYITDFYLPGRFLIENGITDSTIWNTFLEDAKDRNVVFDLVESIFLALETSDTKDDLDETELEMLEYLGAELSPEALIKLIQEWIPGRGWPVLIKTVFES